MAAATPYVDSENLVGAEVATQHLLALGRRTIGTVTGPLDMPAGVDRLAGFTKALGASFRQDLVESGDFTQLGGEVATERLLERVPDLDGLFAASDLMALGALAALRRAGRRVPEDVAVVGFDDNEFATTADPPLTTMRQDPMIMGRAMVRLYLARHRPDIEVAPGGRDPGRERRRPPGPAGVPRGARIRLRRRPPVDRPLCTLDRGRALRHARRALS